MIVISLWLWREASTIADWAGAEHPSLATYALRLTAVAGIAVAQVLLLNLVVGRIYRPGLFDEVLRRAAGLVIAVAMAVAAAFAFLAK
jgi:hypothetical protein